MSSRCGVLEPLHHLPPRQAEGATALAPVEWHTRLLIVDEADSLRTHVLEMLRDLFDRYGIGVGPAGTPGLEKKLARYLRPHRRIGFPHPRPTSVAG